MRSTVLSAIGLSLVLSACQTMPTASTGPALDQHLDEMLTWFPGVYDNFEQIESERESDLEANLRHRHLNHTFYPVAIPGIPGRQLYAQQYQHHDPANLYRQRIYSFEPDAEEDAIRLTIYTPESPDALTDIHLSPDRQAAMTADDFILKPGCEVYWKRAEDQFEGYLTPKACSYYSTRYETQVYLEETLTLRRDALLLNDRGVDGDGNLIFGVDDKGPTLNLKQTDFSQLDRKSTRLNSSHVKRSRMPSSA